MNLRLRFLLVAAFTLIASVPVVFLTVWVQKSSLQKEVAAVQEKHLLLAGNVTAALERYAKDAGAAFDYYVVRAKSGQPLDGFMALATQLGFRDFCILDAKGEMVGRIGDGDPKQVPIPAAIESSLRATVGDKIGFSRVVRDALGRSTVYLARRLEGGRMAFAALDTGYIVQLQKAIAFGRNGHAAIVDHEGNLIAHPKPEWQEAHKNIAQVETVQRMLRGETGVATFYSPAMKQDMISGYTTAAGPGWGVMVPQPLGELEARASDIRHAAFAIGLAGIAIAAVIGWFLAGLITEPVQAVLRAAGAIRRGHFEARVGPGVGLVASEFRELSEGFNGMAQTIQDDQADLLRALEGIQIADRVKSEFLAAMGHELRTPLNAVIGFSEAIDKQIYGAVGDPRYREYAQNIRASGVRLLGVINDILDHSKIEGGALQVEDGTVDLEPMVRGALALIEEPAREAEVQVRFLPSPGLPSLRGSEVKLKRVLFNLLSNAVRFTPAGGKVTVAAWRQDDGDAAIRVEDSGIGMTEEEIEIALTPFRQVDGSLSRRHDGTGLGLPLAKRLVELHGGALEIRSRPGVGTSVTLTLKTGPQDSQAL